MRKGYWKTKQGRVVKISSMSNDCLLNIYNAYRYNFLRTIIAVKKYSAGSRTAINLFLRGEAKRFVGTPLKEAFPEAREIFEEVEKRDLIRRP
jgi:hypothetical protein